MPRMLYAVVGNAVLRVVIRAYFFRTVLCANLFPARLTRLAFSLFNFRLQQLCPQYLKCPLFICGLRSFFGHRNNNTRGLVNNTERRFYFVYILPPGASRAVRFGFDVLRANFYIYLFGFG